MKTRRGGTRPEEKPKAEPQPEEKPKAEPQPEEKPKAEPQPEEKPKAEPQPEEKPKAEPQSEEKSKADLEAEEKRKLALLIVKEGTALYEAFKSAGFSRDSFIELGESVKAGKEFNSVHPVVQQLIMKIAKQTRNL